MPAYPQPADQWLTQMLAQMRGDIQQLKTQPTQYVVDAEGICRAIIGNLTSEPGGGSTGLTGWGVAVLSAGAWQQVSGGVTVARAYRSTAFTLKPVTLERIPLNAVAFDPGSHFDTGHGYYVVPQAGYYQLSGSIAPGPGAETTTIMSFFVNGAEISRPARIVYTFESNIAGSDIVHCNAGDHLELAAYSTLERALSLGGAAMNYLSVVRVA